MLGNRDGLLLYHKVACSAINDLDSLADENFVCVLDMWTGDFLLLENSYIMYRKVCQNKHFFISVFWKGICKNLTNSGDESLTEDSKNYKGDIHADIPQNFTIDTLRKAVAELACKSASLFSKHYVFKKRNFCGVNLEMSRRMMFADLGDLFSYNCKTENNMMVLSLRANCLKRSQRKSNDNSSIFFSNYFYINCQNANSCEDSDIASSKNDSQRSSCVSNILTKNIFMVPDLCTMYKEVCHSKQFLFPVAKRLCDPNIFLDVQTTTLEIPKLKTSGLATLTPPLPLPLVASEACRTYNKICKDRIIVNPMTFCVFNNNNRTYTFVKGLCVIHKLNCHHEGLLTIAADLTCLDNAFKSSLTTISLSKTSSMFGGLMSNEKACNKFRKCEPDDEPWEVCAFFTSNGTLILLENICAMLKMACETKSVLWKTSDNQCEGLSVQRSDRQLRAEGTTKKYDRDILDITRNSPECDKWSNCTASLTSEEIICAADTYGIYTEFKNICLMHRFNCVTKGKLVQVDDKNCRLENKLSYTAAYTTTASATDVEEYRKKINK